MAFSHLDQERTRSGAKPESPHLVEWPATPLPFGRREVSIKGRRPPDESSGSRYSGVRHPALAGGV